MNVNIDHMFFELNCCYYLYVLIKDKVNSYSKSYLANELAKKLKDQYQFISKTFSIFKNFRNKPMIKVCSLIAMT